MTVSLRRQAVQAIPRPSGPDTAPGLQTATAPQVPLSALSLAPCVWSRPETRNKAPLNQGQLISLFAASQLPASGLSRRVGPDFPHIPATFTSSKNKW